ncbi:hypothetical protein A0U93_14425 [Neoasaia chiangmaiensis]|uniref:Fusaric acid resistance protein FusB n=2 Tax=Neoasaia chiangmaiensis TaxID=320497 RepID=A0A1U9KUP1_9PROT|nr:hypothetical protein A0U93_14425 [Neoasaia chiangmaiensis]
MADWPFAWIYAPKSGSLMFALRNTIAALVALAIAFWMELGEPQWAPMTVWIVAQGSRGESLSKGRWRLVGTVLGMISAIALLAMFPQAPWLFLPALAIWAGLCAGLATLVHNFRSYAFVLAAYTCAIIAMGASSEPDHVFQIAMARGTYIFLGVICEMVAGLIFSHDMARQARQLMRGRLLSAITSATAAIVDILREEPPPESDIRAVFSQTLTLHDQIEFSAVEIGRNERAVQCAYATIGLLSRIMSRGLGLRTRLAAVPNRSATSQDIIIRATELLSALPQRIAAQAEVVSVRNQVDALISRTIEAVERTLVQEMAGGDAQKVAINDRIALQGVRLMLNEYHALLSYFGADPRENLHPDRYRLRHFPNWRAALHNGLRSMAAILAASLVWEVTAWPNGAAFVSFIAVVCGRFATFENTVLVSNKFFYGACVATLASIIPVFLLVPLGSSFGALAIAITPFMFIGGLAAQYGPTALQAASYNTFFPALLGLDNQHRLNELQWFNNTIALLLGLGAGVIVFKCVLPFDERRVCWIMRGKALSGLRHISRHTVRMMDENHWIGRNTQSMQRLIRYAGSQVTPLMDTYLHGTLAIMTIGRNLMHLRHAQHAPNMPEAAATAIQAMFARLAERNINIERLHAETTHTLKVLSDLEETNSENTYRMALTDAIGSLLIVSAELSGNRAFLDTRTFVSNMLTLETSPA